jgi:pSer/pThr/pTyr-binding forkhead associated (FHA) protein/S1-C subfamily serine protease
MIRITILTGPRAGLSLDASGEKITIGRAPDADLRLHPLQDILVSAHHATLWSDGQTYFIRDLGSRNGTFLNGVRIPPGSDRKVRDGDLVDLGSDAARIQILTTARTDTAGPPIVTASPTMRIQAAVAQQTRWLRRVIVLGGITLVGGTTFIITSGQGHRLAWERERAELQQRIDSITWVSEEYRRHFEEELLILDRALAHAREEVDQLNNALASARLAGDHSRITELQRQLQAATVALQQHQLTANLDFRTIERANRRAVAIIYVESENGTISTATAFAVHPNGTLLTNRHIVAGLTGRERPRRIAIQFADSEQVWPARLLGVSSTTDLAAVKVDNIIGDVPTVLGFNPRLDTLPRGLPVAAIGFPLGGAPSIEGGGDGTGYRARPLLLAGIVSRTSATGLEFLGYGTSGASGSPIFDGNGEVVAILYGGRNDETGHRSLGLPAAAALDFLARLH